MKRLLLSVSLLCAYYGIAKEKSPAVLFEKGLHYETTVGDLDKAIEIYSKLVDDHREEQKIAATALLRLGKCYQQQGDMIRARQNLNDVVWDFPSQGEQVESAEEILEEIRPKSQFFDIDGCRVVRRADVKIKSKQLGFVAYQGEVIELSFDKQELLTFKGRDLTIELMEISGERVFWKGTLSGKETSIRFPGWVGTINDPLPVGNYRFKISEAGKGSSQKTTVFELPMCVEQVIYSQIGRNEILPDGSVTFANVMQILQLEEKPISEQRFMSNDFFQLTEMISADGTPLEFTSKHRGRFNYYRIAFPTPFTQNQLCMFGFKKGTLPELMKEVAGEENVFEYDMNHQPGPKTRRIEIYTLPKGAELISAKPEGFKTRNRNGRVELCVEKIIPQGGDIHTVIRYRLKK